MHKGVGAAIAIICVIVAFIFFPQVMRTAEEAKVREATETHLVVTGVAEEEAEVTLYNDLYSANLEYVVEINSSNENDTPVATAYNEVTQKLTVGGLVVEVTRNLEISYDTDAIANLTGVGAFLGLTPFLFLGGIIAIVGAVIWHSFRSR
jgi:uncharacterized membrane protein YhiD involved in acid resistance